MSEFFERTIMQAEPQTETLDARVSAAEKNQSRLDDEAADREAEHQRATITASREPTQQSVIEALVTEKRAALARSEADRHRAEVLEAAKTAVLQAKREQLRIELESKERSAKEAFAEAAAHVVVTSRAFTDAIDMLLSVEESRRAAHEAGVATTPTRIDSLLATLSDAAQRELGASGLTAKFVNSGRDAFIEIRLTIPAAIPHTQR